MSGAQRRKRREAERRKSDGPKSGGPKTEEGKLVSRTNSLKHGLTTRVLTLPGENPDEIRARAEEFHQTWQPQGASERVLVDEIALAALRMDRIAETENDILTGQILVAEAQWDLEQNTRLDKFRRMLKRDRITAILNLRSFGAGVSWLLEKWKVLDAAFTRHQGWKSVTVIREAILHRGMHDESLSSGYEFAHLAVSCIEDHESKKELVHFLGNYHDECRAYIDSPDTMKQFLDSMASYITDDCQSRAGVRELSVTEARRTMRIWLDRQMADLRELDGRFREADAKMRAGATVRARTPDDTPKNRVLMRYMKSAELAYDRGVKTLTQLQKERKNAAEEAEEADLPNEPTESANVPEKELAPGSYVRLVGVDYRVAETGDDHMILTKLYTTTVSQPLEVAAASENGV